MHESVNIRDTSIIICNRCPCCRGILKSAKEFRDYDIIAKSNYAPRIDNTLCQKCEKCIEICKT
ncbi:MAG: hypothetical protein Q6352_008255 [Candidatus Freyrarchaeum guaymaensis]